jgi:hypothetical protein
MQYVPAEKERLDHEVAARRAWDKGSKYGELASFVPGQEEGTLAL